MLVVSREILLFPLHLVGYDWPDKNSLKFQIDQRTGSLMSSIEKFCRKGICKFRSNSPPCKCHTYDKSFPIECFELETRCPREIRSSIFLLWILAWNWMKLLNVQIEGNQERTTFVFRILPLRIELCNIWYLVQFLSFERCIPCVQNCYKYI